MLIRRDRVPQSQQPSKGSLTPWGGRFRTRSPRPWEGPLVLGVLVAQSALGLGLKVQSPRGADPATSDRLVLTADVVGDFVEDFWNWLLGKDPTPPPPPPPPPEEGVDW